MIMTASPDEPPVAPDPQTLLRITGIALAVAAVVLVVAVLPAEYGVDPTGLGGPLGLTELSETGPGAGPAVRVGGEAFRVREANVTVPAGDGLEWKMRLEAGAPVVFAWETRNGSAVFTDFHGEPHDAAEGEFTSFAAATTTNQTGDLRSPFRGTVGWYWENQGDAAATVDLRVAGVLEVVGTLD